MENVDAQGGTGRNSRLVLTIAAAAALAWSVVLGGSWLWNRDNASRTVMDTAYAEARANLNKDITFRRWATDHGGLYVPVTPLQPPVQWLSHVPDRDVLTHDGRRLTLLNPASALRQIMTRYADDYGVPGRITGLRYINPANAPDPWERSQLERFTTGQRAESWAVQDMGGKPHLRFMRAMVMEQGCMHCHAGLGYKVGEVRGATGVNLPLAGYYRQLDATRTNIAASHIAIWLVGLAGLAWSARLVHRHETMRHRAEQAILTANERLEQRVEERTGELRLAMRHLVASEKMASLGALVAGVAHELNTPIGNIVLAGSGLGDQVRQAGALVAEGRLTKSGLSNSLAEWTLAAEAIERNSFRANELIESFKRVAVDQTSQRHGRFSVLRAVEDSLAALAPALRRARVRIDVEIPETLEMDSYPGHFEQIVSNLVQNSLVHGFDGKPGGVIRIAASSDDGLAMTLRYEDDGKGIAPALQDKIFEPFYTTRMGLGGSGLGLSIVRNLVYAIFKGEIALSSTPGHGAVFVLRLPLCTAPDCHGAA